MPEKDTIYAAMARVSDEVRYIQKRGQNKEQKYSYVMESDVKEAFHRAFQRHGILFLPTIEDCTVEPHVKGNEKGEWRSGYVATLRLRIHLVLASIKDDDVTLAEGQRVRSPSVAYAAVAIGQGYDTTDKAVNKAYTSAIKNFLLSTFLVSSGDDPETDEDGQTFDGDVIEETFDSIAKSLKACEPAKGKAKEMLASMYSSFKAPSGRPVEHPREFARRADALACLAGLKQIEKQWRVNQMDAESESGQAQERAREKFKGLTEDQKLDVESAAKSAGVDLADVLAKLRYDSLDDVPATGLKRLMKEIG